MARNKELIMLRNNKIRERFERLNGIKTNGVTKYSYPYILNKLKYEFYLETITIEDILFKCSE
jgi:hypothetical protein